MLKFFMVSAAPDSTTTEEDVCFFVGAMPDAVRLAATRRPGAVYWIPGVNEWRKAAYDLPIPCPIDSHRLLPSGATALRATRRSSRPRAAACHSGASTQVPLGAWDFSASTHSQAVGCHSDPAESGHPRPARRSRLAVPPDPDYGLCAPVMSTIRAPANTLTGLSQWSIITGIEAVSSVVSWKSRPCPVARRVVRSPKRARRLDCRAARRGEGVPWDARLGSCRCPCVWRRHSWEWRF